MAANAHDAPSPAAPAPASGRTQTAVGLVFVFVGVVVLLDRSGIVRHYLPEQLWPFVLIIAGALRLTAPAPDDRRRRSRRPGLGWLIVGCWGAINEFRAFGFDYDTSWPLLVIAIWHALDPVAGRREHARE